MNYKDIERIAELEECSNLEFKESTGQLDRSMETLCAFLNGDGGDILYGIKDNGKIIGQEVSDNTKRSIAEAVNRIEPFVELEISYVPIPDTNKYVISIHAECTRYMRPFTYKGRAYMRIESTTTFMPQERYNHLLMERGGKYGWEAIINSDLELSDLDENAILGAVREGIRNGRLPETTIREEIPVILKKFGLLHVGKLNNAAAVLFGKNLYGYPQCLVRMARFRGTTKEELILQYCGDTNRIGLDRIDNSKGHTKDNTVPCCYECNCARNNNFSFEEMKILGKTIKQIKESRKINY